MLRQRLMQFKPFLHRRLVPRESVIRISVAPKVAEATLIRWEKQALIDANHTPENKMLEQQ